MKRRDIGTALLLLGPAQLAWGVKVLAVRVWPAPDYTRVTIESDVTLNATHTFVADPPRLAVDLQGIELTAPLRELVAKVKSDDPHISGARVGQFAPGVLRVVFDLKQRSLPQVFQLTPVPAAGYQHRLVFDLYPERATDPLQALIAEKLAATALAMPPVAPASTPKDPLAEFLAKAPATASAPERPTPAPTRLETATISVATKSTNTLANPEKVVKNTNLEASTTRFIVVALDPGHGGEDPGAIGPGGTREKDVVLAIALKLRDRINATTITTRQGGTPLTLPMRAFLTRDADFFVPLATRVKKAQRVQADLMISIHADAFTTPRASGASVYALSTRGATSAAAQYMAKKENAADLVGGVNIAAAKDPTLQRTLLDMSTTAQINDSLQLGAKFLGEIGAFAKLHKPKVEQAGFAVLKAPDIPSVLIETAFISNPEEEIRLASASYQDQLANALMRGIKQYFSKNPPLARVRVA